MTGITSLSVIIAVEIKRFAPQWLGCIGLASCLFLAFWVEQQI
ncbi:hypothetical protein ACP6PL_07775 [Dapis sp. BLCC M126]